jgi:hypothetical protein
MTSKREGDEDRDFISPEDDTIDITARTRVAYANARERNSFLHAGPSGSHPQPRRGRSHVKNPYDALVAAPSNLSKYSDPEYFDNRFTSTKSLHQTRIPESFGHSERPANSNQDNSNRHSEDSVQGNSGGSRGS